MADKINRSPPPVETTTNNNISNLPQPSSSISPTLLSPLPSSGVLLNETCSCSKIAIIQLFHEMKQKFPTIPDSIVYTYVKNNCHNPAACIEGLHQEATENPGSVNPYPLALRNQDTKKANMFPVRRPPAIPTIATSAPSVCIPMISHAKNAGKSTPNERNKENEQTTEQKPVAQRPNTLNLRSLDSLIRLDNRPTRMAPPPPATSTGTTPNDNSNSKAPLNVSLNVIVSPVSGRPPVRPPRGSSNNLNTADGGHSHHRSPKASSPRNITSLTFTLHQPSGSSNNQQSGLSGADDANGPSLTYASSSYDTETGYQSRLEIVVAGNNGNVSGKMDGNAVVRQKSNVPVIETRNEYVQNSNAVNQGSRIGGSSIPNVVATPGFLEEADTVHHQLLCKQRLVVELEKDKKRLEMMQRELKAIQAPLPVGGVQALSAEIQKLRETCDQMVKEVEEAGPSYALGETNEAFYQNIYTGQRLPIQQMRTASRTNRPPPPQMPAAFCRNSNQPSTTVNQSYLSPLNHQQQSNNHNQPNQDLTAAPCSSSTPTANTTTYNDDEEGEGWTCNMCTFQNHQFLTNCEQCDMPLLSAGNNVANSGSMPMPHFVPPAMQPPYLQHPRQHPQSNQFVPTILHIPYQRQTTTNRLPPIVLSYPNPFPTPGLTQQH